jgi:hypothetical protein
MRFDLSDEGMGTSRATIAEEPQERARAALD